MHLHQRGKERHIVLHFGDVCQCADKASKFNRGQRPAHQYGSRVKMNVVPVTIGALAPTNDTLTFLT
jgi:hypothetical protein